MREIRSSFHFHDCFIFFAHCLRKKCSQNWQLTFNDHCSLLHQPGFLEVFCCLSGIICTSKRVSENARLVSLARLRSKKYFFQTITDGDRKRELPLSRFCCSHRTSNRRYHTLRWLVRKISVINYLWSLFVISRIFDKIGTKSGFIGCIFSLKVGKRFLGLTDPGFQDTIAAFEIGELLINAKRACPFDLCYVFQENAVRMSAPVLHVSFPNYLQRIS